MEETGNQRLKKAIDKLISIGKIDHQQDLGPIIGGDKHRVSYLVKDGGGKIRVSELNILKKQYPEVNWEWVSSGEGEMLRTEVSTNQVNEPRGHYGEWTDEQKQAELRRIASGKSELDLAEQLELMVEDWLRLKDKIQRALEYNEQSLFDRVQAMIKGSDKQKN